MALKLMNLTFVAIIAISGIVGGCLKFPPQKADMTGGWYIVYKIDGAHMEADELNKLTKKTIEALKRRVDGENVLKLAWIARDNGHFEVQIPLPDESVKRKHEAYMQALVQLEGQDVKPGDAMWYHAQEEIPDEIKKDKAKYVAVKKYFKALDRYIAYLGIYDPVNNCFDPNYVKYKITQSGYLDFRVLPTVEHDNTIRIEAERYVEQLKAKGPDEASDKDYIWCQIKDFSQWHVPGSVVGSYEGKDYVLASNNPDECMLGGPRAHWRINRLSRTYDQMGRPAVGLTFDQKGGDALAVLTGQNIDRPLCILLNNVAMTAPMIESRVRSDVIITGSFTTMEINDIVNYLEAGALSVTIIKTPIAEGIIKSDQDHRDIDSID